MSNDSKRVLTDGEFSKVQGALAVLLGIVGSVDFAVDDKDTASLSGQDVENEKSIQLALARTYIAVENKRNEASRAIMTAAKVGVEAACDEARTATIAAYAELASLSPAAKAMLGVKDPTSCSVLLSSLTRHFPEGMPINEVVKTLHKMNFKLTPGRKDEASRSLFVPISADALKAGLAEING